jgi:hypothetical protein
MRNEMDLKFESYSLIHDLGKIIFFVKEGNKTQKFRNICVPTLGKTKQRHLDII